MKIVSRKEWGAKPANRPSARMENNDISGVFLHWNGPAITLLGKRMPQVIQNYHLTRRTSSGYRKYADIAYSFLVGRDGFVFEGRGWNIRDGSTSSVWHGKSYGVFMATGIGQKIPMAMLEATKDLVTEIRARVGRDIPVKGHRDAYATACPGDEITEWIRRGMPVDSDRKRAPVLKSKDLSPDVKNLPALGNVVLRRGDWRNALPWRKTRINAMQRALSVLGFGLAGTGPWGPKTDAAIKNFQKTYNLSPDGLVGPKTWKALESALAFVKSLGGK